MPSARHIGPVHRFQAAITAGVDPAALVEVINAAQAERTAAQAEINHTPAPELMDAAEVYARIDMLGDIPAKLNAASRDGPADVYTGTDLQVLYEPETSTAEISMRVNSVRVRGVSEEDLAHNSPVGSSTNSANAE
jgi:hypothetical protein